jgi:hypothetical protein
MKHRSFQQWNRLLALLMILSIMVTALSACISTDPLYGTWVEPNSGVQMEIKNNGEIKTTLRGTTFTMKYTLEVPDVMILAGSKDGSVPEQKVTYVATKDTLTLTVDGVNTVFERQK